MDTSYTLLGLLHRQPSYGYDLKRLYDALFSGEKALPYGQIYATLARLVRDGKASVSDMESDKGPDRKRYAITAAGRSHLRTWLQTPIAPEAHLRTTLYAKLLLLILTGASPAEYLQAQRQTHLQRMRELTQLKRRAPLPEQLLIDHALFHVEADLHWIDLTEARLSTLMKEVRI